MTFILAMCLTIFTAQATQQAKPQQVYDWMRQLEGQWTLSPAEQQEGKATQRPEVAAMLGTSRLAMDFKPVGRGSTVQEDLLPGTERQMVTMYHCKDASCSAVKATHY